MAASKHGIKLGILAEDLCDVDVVRLLLRRIDGTVPFPTCHFVGHGCGKLRNKCRDWSVQLAGRGCTVLLLVHDRDRENLKALREKLRAALGQSPIARHAIVIPVEELEAWLLCDAIAIKEAFELRKVPKCPERPDSINDPKGRLADIVWASSEKRKRYIHTIHNVRVAAKVRISSLRKCQAFCELERFWKEALKSHGN